MPSTLRKARLAAKHVVNHALQEVDVRTDGHRSQPSSVYVHLTPTCNLKCIHCNLPKVDGIAHGTLRKVDELSTAEWLRTIDQLANWLGPFKLNFSGGEPLIRRDSMAILRHACQRGAMTGIVSNGTFIDAARADELVEMGMFNVNISLDGFTEETHTHFRGRDFDRTMAAFQHLKAARARHQSELRIIVKFTLMGYNLDEAIEVIRWARDEGLTGVMMQPLELKGDDTELDYLWPDDMGKLDATVDQMLQMQADGYPLLNDTSHIQKFKLYFRAQKHQQASLLQRQGTCHVGVTTFFIGSNGDVVTCFYMDPIGNLREAGPAEIWSGAVARVRREAIRTCDRDCLLTCMTTRTLRDKAGLFLRVF